MSKGKLVAIFMLWMILAVVGAVAWKYVVSPTVEEIGEQRRQDRLNVGSSESHYNHRLTLSLDAFSGYAVIRSPEFTSELEKKSIKLTLNDDKADYGRRIADLKDGSSQMAVFTIDALLKTGSQLGDLPASIVAIVDETRGADAIVGYKSRFKSVDDFNRGEVRFVVTPNSPSETLSRVVMAQFDLPNLPADPFVKASGADDVFRRLQQSNPSDEQVYVLWEPYVTRALRDPSVHTIVSSRDLLGYIVDVLVVSREYLRTHEAVVRDVVECYFRAAYSHSTNMTQLVIDDATRLGEDGDVLDAKRLVDGIQWKNTQHNYAHFGISDGGSAQHIEDMIENIANVLVQTSAISSDPTDGQPNLLYYKTILQDLADDSFHPVGTDDAVDDGVHLRTLSAQEWDELQPVGKLRVPQLIFARGKAMLLERSRNTLDELAETLKTQRYYLKIKGVATRQGDLELNKKLATERAQAAADYLGKQGIETQRMSTGAPELGDVPSVTFTLGQQPY